MIKENRSKVTLPSLVSVIIAVTAITAIIGTLTSSQVFADTTTPLNQSSKMAQSSISGNDTSGISGMLQGAKIVDIGTIQVNAPTQTAKAKDVGSAAVFSMSTEPKESAKSNTNETAVSAANQSKLIKISGSKFVPGTVVLIWSNDNLVAIDEVDDQGKIDAKINPTFDVKMIKVVESDTLRTGSFTFNGKSLDPGANSSEITAK